MWELPFIRRFSAFVRATNNADWSEIVWPCWTSAHRKQERKWALSLQTPNRSQRVRKELMWIYQRQIMPLFLLWQDERIFCMIEVRDALHLKRNCNFFMLFHNRKPECPSQRFAAKQKGCIVWYSLWAWLTLRQGTHIFYAQDRQHLEGATGTWEDRFRSLNLLKWAWNKMIIPCEHTVCAMYQLHKGNMENG